MDFRLALDRAPGERVAFEEELGTAFDSGLGLFAGVVPTLGLDLAVSDPAATVDPVRTVWHRLGLDPETLARVVVTPTCGLAGVPAPAVRDILTQARAAARVLVDDPEERTR
jgi:hypothetical protein